jgi:GT2 family glycosyltransferase
MASFKYDKTTEIEQISTTFLMIRKELLEQIGYFDKSYKILYNDVDLCKKIWETGKKIFFLHNAEVIHHGSQSTKKAGFKERRIMYSDIYRYYRRNFGIRAMLLLPVLGMRLVLAALSKR